MAKTILFAGLLGLWVTGCVATPDSGSGFSMTQSERVEAANSWYGWLVNSTEGVMTVDSPTRGETIQILREEENRWRKWRRKVARNLRKSANPREDFYADIDTILPRQKLLASRARLQTALVETSRQKDKVIIERYALAADHAVLTERVVRLGNGVAMGAIKSPAFLDEVENLKMFRSTFHPLLSKNVPILENQEREAGDATGLALLETVGSDRILVDFFRTPEAMFQQPAGDEKDGTEARDQRWEKSPRRIFPTVSPVSDATAGTMFRWRVPALKTMDGISSCRLVFWAATASFSVTLNGRDLGRVDGAEDGRSVALPVEASTLSASKDRLTLIVSQPGKHPALPFRAAFLSAAD